MLWTTGSSLPVRGEQLSFPQCSRDATLGSLYALTLHALDYPRFPSHQRLHLPGTVVRTSVAKNLSTPPQNSTPTVTPATSPPGRMSTHYDTIMRPSSTILVFLVSVASSQRLHRYRRHRGRIVDVAVSMSDLYRSDTRPRLTG